jgi:oxygen-independent coproporphyrinogen III oxidase
MDRYSIYLHFPFCKRKCSYCDFNSYAGQDHLIPSYIAALNKEISLIGRSTDQKLPVHSLYFGGGTPSLARADQLESVMKSLSAHYNLLPEIEVSIEVNPGTVTAGYLSDLKGIGFNRLSIGMQSALENELAFLRRIHSFKDTQNTVEWARRAGFENLSLDLIFGIPGQTLVSCQSSLKSALALEPEHISFYSLTVEAGTKLGTWVDRGLVEAPDDDLAADMYLWANDHLSQNGFERYEISNWARKDKGKPSWTSRHNLQYWRCSPYLGFGAGAHGFANHIRYSNVLPIGQYIQKIVESDNGVFPAGPALLEKISLDRITEMQETMMVGLRMTQEGVSNAIFYSRFGENMRDVFAKEIADLNDKGLVEWIEDGARLRLRERGVLLGNQVFMQFVNG